MQPVDLIWTIVGFTLTLLIFSYVFGDNPLFRLASYLFVGVTAGYVAVIIIYQVLLPRLVWPLMGGSFLLVVPLILGLLLLSRLIPRYSTLGGPSMGYLVGAGAAVAVGGAVMGTLVTQLGASINLFDFRSAAALNRNPVFVLVEGAFLLVGTISTLVYFQFGASARDGQIGQRPPFVEALARIGQVFIAITLGAIFAGVFAAAITAMIDRLDFIIESAIKIFFR